MTTKLNNITDSKDKNIDIYLYLTKILLSWSVTASKLKIKN